MFLHNTIQELSFFATDHALLDEHVAERLLFVQHPAAGSGDQIIAGDEVELHSQDAKQQIAICGSCTHGKNSLARQRRYLSRYA